MPNVDLTAVDVAEMIFVIAVARIEHPLQEMTLPGGRLEHATWVTIVQFLPDPRGKVNRSWVVLKPVVRVVELRIHGFSPAVAR